MFNIIPSLFLIGVIYAISFGMPSGKILTQFRQAFFFLVATKIVNQTQFCVKNSFTAIKASPRISQSVFKAIVGHMSPFPYEIESNFTLTPNCQKTDKRLSVNQMSIVSACGLPFPLLVRLGFLPSSISSNIWIEGPRGKGVKSVNWSSLQAGGKSSWLTNPATKASGTGNIINRMVD